MILDLLDFCQTKPGIALGGTHYMNTQIIRDKNDPNNGTIVCFKSASGSPVDTFPFGPVAVLMGSTEFDKQGWHDPSAVKLHVDLVIFSPRDIGNVNASIANYSSSRRIQFDNGGKLQFNASHQPVWTVGQIVTQFRGLVTMDFKKDVKVQQAAVIDYYWNYPHDRETYYLVKDLGEVQWEHATLQNNKYVIDNQSVFNIITPTTTVPVLNYPVGNILGV